MDDAAKQATEHFISENVLILKHQGTVETGKCHNVLTHMGGFKLVPENAVVPFT